MTMVIATKVMAIFDDDDDDNNVDDDDDEGDDGGDSSVTISVGTRVTFTPFRSSSGFYS